jgi:DNA-binding CsgD family transcriptional regulator
MVGVIPPKREMMLNAASDVDKVCAPLKLHGIKFFSFVRIFSDGSRINLNNDISAAKYTHYDSDAYKEYQAEANVNNFSEGVYFGQAINDKTLILLRNKFDIDHMLIFVKKYHNYVEIFNFGTYADNAGVYSLYLNNMNYFQKFQYYFKDNLSDLIKLYGNHRLDTPNIKDLKLANSDEVILSIDNLKIQRYFVDGDYIYLTAREVECLDWLAKGKSSSEIALILNIKQRTVEKHIESAKLKLNCNKSTSLIYKAVKLGIIS